MYRPLWTSTGPGTRASRFTGRPRARWDEKTHVRVVPSFQQPTFQNFINKNNEFPAARSDFFSFQVRS